jgi:hypothetical protein
MRNFYTTKRMTQALSPKEKTIRFLLDYSKSLKVVKTKTNYAIKLHLN